MKVYIESLGCDSTLSDANRLRECCLNNFIEITEDYLSADNIVLFSCGFNEIILRDNLKKLSRLRQNKKAKLILAGCIPKIISVSKRIADEIVGPKEISKFNTLFNLKIEIEQFSPKFEREDRQIIRISTGCCGKCSYCAIKIATGFIKSRNYEDIIKDLRDGLKRGVKKFVFTSEDNGSWGQDMSTNICFLLEKIEEMHEHFKVLITTFNPKWFLRYPQLYNLLKSDKFEKNIYLSLQSGSDRILKLMKREYSVDDYIRVYHKLKKEIPEIKIRSDFLVGFPSETEEDFNKTYNLINNLDFYFIQVFAYTDMRKTLAKKINPKITKNVKYSRVKKLIELFLKKNENEKRALIQTNIY
jgi:MiaB/RimO family radical SAM methylthiotransferase